MITIAQSANKQTTKNGVREWEIEKKKKLEKRNASASFLPRRIYIFIFFMLSLAPFLLRDFMIIIFLCCCWKHWHFPHSRTHSVVKQLWFLFSSFIHFVTVIISFYYFALCHFFPRSLTVFFARSLVCNNLFSKWWQ